MTEDLKQRLVSLASVFLKLGVIGFGGPAAHIAMMEAEIVTDRQWLERSQFLDLLGATNLIPGPNSTEMAIHVGYIYGGVWGLMVAGICFLFPAIIMTTILAIIYTQFGSLPQIAPLLFGIKPAVIVVIISALYRLGKKAIKQRKFWLIFLLVIILNLLGLNEIFSLLLGGLFGMVGLILIESKANTIPLLVFFISNNIAQATNQSKPTPSLWQLGLFFLKIGSILFGSGYVLIAFLEGELVNQYGWLTQQQLLDAIAIGQFTPGPLLSTATFIGYVILGMPGAIVATLGICLPSFFIVLAVNPIIPKLRRSKWTAAFLDAVNVSAVAIMVVVTLNLLYQILWVPTDGLPVNWEAILIIILAGFALFKYKLNAAWVVLGSSIIGWGLSYI
ncbi:chromate efflux transporter [Crocosphaera watsonii]|uniref:Chromate transporter n=6 Tax=Crocosphaera TaxID=263510 RepID=Q4CB65_CROWT|nr:chromate efflux transporter [Crocosphaera watsonii]EAM52721.1 Chromate transporter [Crocosphaera watsonii WH 8501]CCQ52707.1 Chromate transport protein [Crocosphaera watsonii WH 8502]CCQ60486.1 COG2059: Chromate transport protein ChrA [Crocosphaera watsonii WH 0401]